MTEQKQSVVMLNPRKEDGMYREAIKNLRTNLQFAGVDIKTILITSCFPNEGKSDVAFQLAREIGNIRKKVLLLDADIRKSAFVSRYKIGTKVKGLTHYLSGQMDRDGIIYSTNYRNVDILFAGSTAPNPSELLESSAMESLMGILREEYDYVLVDTPPAATMSDAVIVAKWCDGAVMVLESGRVGYRIAQRVKSQIAQTGCKMLGVVLNKVDTQNDRYYGRYGYYGKYGYGYGYGRHRGYGYGYYGEEENQDQQS